MRISDSHRILFVHPPKTGGGTVERVLDNNVADLRYEGERRHDTLAEILAVEPELVDYWIFGFVRNPWARMVSWWSMIENSRLAAEAGDEKNIAKFETYDVRKLVRGYDFATFLTKGADEVERIRTPQIEFLSVDERRPDFIGLTENIAEDINVVRKRIGARPRAKLPHRHRGRHGPYRDYYTPALRDRVAELFKADIDEFGYEF